ncbi:MAG: RNA polymerase sigma-70 factor [Bacteroidetes bacterium]|nr:RNA polymerase sigma-70 factor [Bacteroidota bacterium]
MNEKILLCQISKGDERAFRQLYEQYHNKVYYVALKILKTQTGAEDVLQNIFMKIWEQKKTLPAIENFEAYLNIMLRNHLFNQLRKLIHEKQAIKKIAISQTDSINETLHTVLDREFEHELQVALQHLPPQQKKVFTLSRIEGLKHDEIAAALHISKETVKKHIMKAADSVKACLESPQGSELLLLFSSSLLFSFLEK